jgi:hypothetical protein
MTLVDNLKELDTQDDSLWTMACAYDYLIPCRGVCVLLGEVARRRCSVSTTVHYGRWATSTRFPGRR